MRIFNGHIIKQNNIPPEPHSSHTAIISNGSMQCFIPGKDRKGEVFNCRSLERENLHAINCY